MLPDAGIRCRLVQEWVLGPIGTDHFGLRKRLQQVLLADKLGLANVCFTMFELYSVPEVSADATADATFPCNNTRKKMYMYILVQNHKHQTINTHIKAALKAYCSFVLLRPSTC